jgi:hypothetical protein
MNRCAYCGKENPNSAGQCGGCGTNLPPLPKDTPGESSERTVFMTTDQVAELFPRAGEFTRPDWAGIRDLIRLLGENLSEPECRETWANVAMTWATRLAEDFGGNYRAVESPNFICLSELEAPDVRRVLRFAEHAESSIRTYLGYVAWQGDYKHLVILLTEQDDYDHYVAQFYTEGSYAATLGLQINAGYPHLVVHFVAWHEGLTTLVHELAHACVSHLPLPRWLDEGVAQALAKKVGDVPPPARLTDAQAIWSIQSGWTPPLMSGELAERHHEFWNEENIQGFWAGTSFFEPGESNELSYSLAEVLVNLIAQDYGEWLEFLTQAQWDDAGQTAALDCFGTGLGEIAGAFLGEGEWRPVRKELVAHWQKAGWEK